VTEGFKSISVGADHLAAVAATKCLPDRYSDRILGKLHVAVAHEGIHAPGMLAAGSNTAMIAITTKSSIKANAVRVREDVCETPRLFRKIYWYMN
jgi:hypothetical protein